MKGKIKFGEILLILLSVVFVILLGVIVLNTGKPGAIWVLIYAVFGLGSGVFCAIQGGQDIRRQEQEWNDYYDKGICHCYKCKAESEDKCQS